jgi:hypothetical protein
MSVMATDLDDEMTEWDRVMAYADGPEIDRLAAMSEAEFQAELAQERREKEAKAAPPTPIASSPRLDEAHSYDVSPASGSSKVASLADARAKRDRPFGSYLVYAAAAAVFGWAVGHQMGLWGDPHAADPNLHPAPPSPSQHVEPTGPTAPSAEETQKLVEAAVARAKIACDAKDWEACKREIHGVGTLDDAAILRPDVQKMIAAMDRVLEAKGPGR